MAVDSNDLLRQYKAYDLRCDVVSSFEVFLTRAKGLSDTVVHFERFPRWTPTGEQEVTPDFTARFTDVTMLVGEIANLARTDGSLKSLLRQIGRYDAPTEGPSALRPPQGHEIAAVVAVDVLVLIPLAEMNAACDRIADAIANKHWGYEPSNPPTVIGYSYEDTGAGSRLVFSFPDRAGNPYPRAHGREPSLASWLKSKVLSQTPGSGAQLPAGSPVGFDYGSRREPAAPIHGSNPVAGPLPPCGPRPSWAGSVAGHGPGSQPSHSAWDSAPRTASDW